MVTKNDHDCECSACGERFAKLAEIKRIALACTPTETPLALARIIRLCIDAGVKRGH